MKNLLGMMRSLFCSTALWNRSGWLYLIIGVMLYALIDHNEVYLNRMNVLKDVEYNLKESLDRNKAPQRDDLRWGLRYYQKLQRYARNNSIYYGNLGFCHYYLGEYDNAVRSYKKAIALEPRFYMYHYDLGFVYFRQGQVDKAQNAFLTALNYIDDSVNYFVEMAEALQMTHGEELNFVAMSLIKRAGQDERDIIIRLINIYSRTQEYEKVIAMAEHGLEARSKSWEFYEKAGWAAYMLKRYQQAIHYLTRAIDLEPRAMEAVYYRGLSLLAIGQEAEGTADLLRLKQMKAQGVTPPDVSPQYDDLHLNIELRILRQRFG